MKVNKPMSVKIEKTIFKLNPGSVVPEKVLSFWKKSNQMDFLLKNNFISDQKKQSKNEINDKINESV